MGFLPFLPQDNRSAEVSAEEAVELISQDLHDLLLAERRVFWDTVAKDESLISCIDSYLQFRRRPHDVLQGASTAADDDPPAALLLSRRVFMVLFRLVSLEPGQSSGPSPAKQAELLQKRQLFTVPRLMDIAALYGSENPDLTQRLMREYFQLHPNAADDVAEAGPVIHRNLQDVESRCAEGLLQLRLGSDASLLAGLADGTSYIKDTVITLVMFVEAYPTAARLLLRDGPSLIGILGALHNSLLPRIAGALTDAACSQEILLAIAAVEGLTWTLLNCAFIRESAVEGDAFSPLQLGERLLDAISAAAASPSSDEKDLLQALQAQWALADCVFEKVKEGKLSMDETQLDYLAAVLNVPNAALRLAELRAAAHSGTAVPVSGSTAIVDALAPLIAQVKEMLPDYGDGFLEAALEANGRNVERTLNCLLEGNLPSELTALDPQLPRTQAPSQSAGTSGGASTSSWTDLRADHSDAQRHNPAAPKPGAAPARTGKGRVPRAALAVLDERGSERTATSKAVIARIQAMELEYEDEYDDSFDELSGGVADGATEVESVGEAKDSKALKAAPAGGESEPGLSAGGAPKPSRPGKNRPLYLLNGRVYNYPKEGAQKVASQEEAERIMKADAEQVLGLGPGGNKPHSAGAAGEASGSSGGRGSQGRGRGRGQQGQGRGGQGRGQGSYAHKDKNKAAVANHHRKDRSMKKMGM